MNEYEDINLTQFGFIVESKDFKKERNECVQFFLFLYI